MKNKLVFDNRKLHYTSKRIFITGCTGSERVYRFSNSSIGNIEIWKTFTDILNTDIILDDIYIENLLSNDITIRDMTIDVIINENKDFINQYLKNKI